MHTHLPNVPAFVIIGAQKCGTTSLHGYLSQHPALYLSPNKEPLFFNCPGDGSPPPWNDLENYRSLVASPTDYSRLFDGANGRLTGEGSTMYLPDPSAPGRLLQASPGVKVIALVRDPGARALSAWRMWRRASLEPLEFKDAISSEVSRKLAGAGYGRDYVENGRYLRHLDRWRDALGDDRVLILKSDDLGEQPVSTLIRIFDVLEVDSAPALTIDLARRAVGDRVPRNYRLAAYVRHGQAAKFARSVLPSPIRSRLGAAIKTANSFPAQSIEIDPELLNFVREQLAEDTRELAHRMGWDLATWLPH